MDLHIYRNSQDRGYDLKTSARQRGAVLAVNAVTVDELVQRITPDLETATAGQRLSVVHRALAGRTRPGPFGPRTIEFGLYIGIRVDTALAAMAGERMRFGRFVEISAVCVDPDHRGKGYAALLVTRLAKRLQAQGLTPFLHAFPDNGSAIALYEKLGFATRRILYVTILRSAPR